MHLHESICYMQGNSKILGHKDLCVGEFPGGLVVGIPGSQCRGPRSVPGRGTEIQQAMWHHQEIKMNSKCMCACVLCCFSPVWLCVALWTIACQASLSMGFSRQEYWSGLLCPPLEDLPDPGIEPASLVSTFIGMRVHVFLWIPILPCSYYDLLRFWGHMRIGAIFSFCSWKTDLEILRNVLIVFHQDSNRTEDPHSCLFIQPCLELFVLFFKISNITDVVKVHLSPSATSLPSYGIVCSHSVKNFPHAFISTYVYTHKSNIVFVVYVCSLNTIVLSLKIFLFYFLIEV